MSASSAHARAIRQTLMNNVIQKQITLNKYCSEYLVALAPELSFSAIEQDMADPVAYPVLVYSPVSQIGANQFVYEYRAARIMGLPNKGVQRTAYGIGLRVRVANLFIRFGWWLAGGKVSSKFPHFGHFID